MKFERFDDIFYSEEEAEKYRKKAKLDLILKETIQDKTSKSNNRNYGFNNKKSKKKRR